MKIDAASNDLSPQAVRLAYHKPTVILLSSLEKTKSGSLAGIHETVYNSDGDPYFNWGTVSGS